MRKSLDSSRLGEGSTLRVPIGPAAGPLREALPTLEDVQCTHIAATLQQTGWRVRGSAGAAVVLGLKPTTLESRIKKLGLQRPR